MSKKCCFNNLFGVIITSVGVGMLVAVIMPIWGWLLLGGCALVYTGWLISQRWRR